MSRIYISFIACCFFVANLLAQTPFAPLGAHWNYTFNSHDGGLVSNYEIRVTHDTLIGNAQVKALTAFQEVTFALPPHQYGAGSAPFGTLTLRNDSVFMSGCMVGTNGYLFNFEMTVGDSIPMLAPGGVLYGSVTGVDSVLVGAINKQRWQVDKYCDTVLLESIQIVEDIGPVSDFLAYNHEGCQQGIGWWVFECYHSSLLQFNVPCPQIVLAGIQDATPKARWQIAPNPSNGHFSIVMDESISIGIVTVLDLQMRTVLANKPFDATNSSIDLSFLQAGLYWVRLEANGQSGIQKLVIAH